MTARISVGSVSSCSAAASLSTSSASATAGNFLVLAITWANAGTGGGAAQTPGTPSGWTKAYGPAAADNGTVAAGFAVYYKTAAGGVESPVFSDPYSTTQLYAHGIIGEWPSTCTFDSTASSGASSTNTTAGGTTGVTVPNTGTLSQSQGFAVAGVAIICGTGLSNANIQFGGGSWTTDISIQTSNTDEGALVGSKALASNAAINAVYTWTSDASMNCYQAAIAMFADSAGAAPANHLRRIHPF